MMDLTAINSLYATTKTALTRLDLSLNFFRTSNSSIIQIELQFINLINPRKPKH
jgi:hypothetical protein